MNALYFYVCNRQQCEMCSADLGADFGCRHTSNEEFAKYETHDFSDAEVIETVGETVAYFEKEREE